MRASLFQLIALATLLLAMSKLPPPPPPPFVPPGPSPAPGTGLVCTQEYVYGIVLHVIDGRSGTPVNNAQAIIQDGSYLETLSPIGAPSQNGLYQGAGERPGTYRLTVSAPGYAPQTFENLVVTGGVCHVQTVSREVSLLPY